MMERMNNADFHKFLTEFSDAVAKGKYKKMPYDKYRELRKIKNSVVDISVNTYTDYHGERISRIIVSPHGSVGYEFDMHDGSFGNFCYDYLKKEEPKVHPDEKKTYDIYGNVIENPVKAVEKEAWLDYCSKKALDDLTATSASCVCNTADKVSALESHWYYDSISTSDSTRATTATIAIDPSLIETRTVVDVLQEEVDQLKKVVDGNNCEIAVKANRSEMDYEIDQLRRAVSDIYERAEDCEHDLRERIEEARTAAIEESWYTRAELEQLLDERIKALEEKFVYAVPADKMIMQSTSSSCYPARNIEIKADYMSAPDNGKEKENMDTNKMFNFDFGPVASHIRMSPYGLAMKNADGKYVSYDKASGNIMDVEIFNFDAQKFLYKMPVAINAIAVGDIVVHMRKAMFVRAVTNGVVSVIDIYNGEVKDILPTQSPFGFNFITKVVSLIDMTGADANSPFGNMLPLLMLGEGQDFKDILPLMLLTGGNTNAMSNPLMLYALMGDGNKDMLPFLFMMGGNNLFAPATPAHNCCHHHENNGECHH